MTRFYAVIPLFHSECRLLGNIPLLLDDKIVVRTMKPEFVGPIISKRRGLTDRLHNGTKTIIVDSGGLALDALTIEEVALAGAFVLNVFAESGAVVCEQAFVIRWIRACIVTNVADLIAYTPTATTKYAIKPDTDPSLFKDTYQATRAALQKDKSLRISIRKFNSAVLKPDWEDRVIDLSICLESLFNSQTEISFKFALFNSLVAEEEPAKRPAAYEMLKRFYKERSNVVHGNTDCDEAWLTANWATLVNIAKLSILKKIDLLRTKAPSDWQKGLDRLALGLPMIGDEGGG